MTILGIKEEWVQFCADNRLRFLFNGSTDFEEATKDITLLSIERLGDGDAFNIDLECEGIYLMGEVDLFFRIFSLHEIEFEDLNFKFNYFGNNAHPASEYIMVFMEEVLERLEKLEEKEKTF